MTQQSKDKRIAILAKQLTDLARRIIDRAFDKPLKADELFELVEDLYPTEWQSDPVEALKVSISDAVEELDENSDRKPLFSSHPDSDLTERLLAYGMFNLPSPDGELVSEELGEFIDGGWYAYLLDKLFKRYGLVNVSDSTRKNKLGDVRKKLVRNLLEKQSLRQSGSEAQGDTVTSTQDALDAIRKSEGEHFDSPRPSSPLLDGRPFIPRPDVAREFAMHDKNGAKLIALVGQAGMGKTWLARRLTMDANETEAPLIRFADGQLSNPDLGAALRCCGIETNGPIGEGQVAYYLEKLLSDANGSRYVILDNLTELAEVRSLLPANRAKTVVLTSRTEGQAPLQECQVIPVGPLEVDQAEQLVRDRVPNIIPADIAYIAEIFEGHPLALDYACSVIRNQKRPVQVFCEEVADDIESLSDSITTAEGRTLAAVLRRILKMLEERDPYGRKILDCAAFLERRPWIHRDFLYYYLKVNTDEGISRGRYTQALETLRLCALVEFRDDARLTIHPFTIETLRALLIDHLPSVALSVHRVMNYYHASDEFSDEWKRRNKSKDFLDSLFSAIVHTADIYGEVVGIQGRHGIAMDIGRLELIEPGFIACVHLCIPSRAPNSPYVLFDHMGPTWVRFDSVSESHFPDRLPESIYELAQQRGEHVLPMLGVLAQTVRKVANGKAHLRV